MINITLPDEKSNYVHRIGRVGRAERMGLAISLVSSVPEKVWYHGEWCHSRGRNCHNTNLTDQGGCCTWYNESRVRSNTFFFTFITALYIVRDLIYTSRITIIIYLNCKEVKSFIRVYSIWQTLKII